LFGLTRRSYLKSLIPSRIPILYSILGVLALISVVPMYFYSAQVESINRERLIFNERFLQNTATVSLGDELSQHQESLNMMLANLSSAVQVASGGDITNEHVETPELRALLENFVSSSSDLAYATLMNSNARGITASSGGIAPDAFLQKELERAFTAAQEGRSYTGQALVVGSGKSQRTVIVVSTPVSVDSHFLGMVAAVEDLQFLIRRLQEIDRRGLTSYVVNAQGRLVAAGSETYATGQDMNNLEIVRNFVEQGGKIQFVAATHEFPAKVNGQKVAMLGTYSPVPNLEWAVVVQKPTADAYSAVFDMQRTARWVAIVTVLLSILVSFLAAWLITSPLAVLTNFSHAIARGDFSQRVKLKSRSEIGELAATFNTMSEELEHFVSDLKTAASENRGLFLSSIQMLAGAVDEKDPYTRGHSDRVTKYSVMIAREMGLDEAFVETVQISAQLHDVGKIGIEDRILKKPGALTPDEFEIMKTHTTKGAHILRGVKQLEDMLPGIELHHESLDGRGYPHGLKGDAIPLLPRIIAVGDTFDALTTNRPYQQAFDPEQALKIIHSLAGKRLDPTAVAALDAMYTRGDIRIQKKVSVPAKPATETITMPVQTPASAASSETSTSSVSSLT
jgi:HD-GYP domain-containing protein (c-di-GMP phosphodiesterase class II)